MARALAAEDKNLTTSIIGTRVRQYKDIDLSLAIKSDGDVYKKQDAAAVKQAVRNLILTNKHEKPFAPNYGADLRQQLFELITPGTSSEIRNNIISAIQRYEPRAQITALQVKPIEGDNYIQVFLQFIVKNTAQQVDFRFTLSRLR